MFPYLEYSLIYFCKALAHFIIEFDSRFPIVSRCLVFTTIHCVQLLTQQILIEHPLHLLMFQCLSLYERNANYLASMFFDEAPEWIFSATTLRGSLETSLVFTSDQNSLFDFTRLTISSLQSQLELSPYTWDQILSYSTGKSERKGIVSRERLLQRYDSLQNHSRI